MNQLIPLSQFNYVIQLGDPTDTNTNFVQSVVRYSSNSTVITTLNMSNKGNQRFTAPFTVPADVSGQGYYLDITTKIYTDSGYTILNPNYPIQTSSFFVLQPLTSSALGGTGGGGMDDEMMKKLLKMILEGIKLPEYKEIDMSPIIDKIDGISVPEAADMSPIHASLSELYKKIGSIKIPEQIKTDLFPVLDGIQNVVNAHVDLEKNISKKYLDHEQMIRKMNKSNIDLIQEAINSLPSLVTDAVQSMKGDVFKIHLSPVQIEKQEKKKETDPKITKLFKS